MSKDREDVIEKFDKMTGADLEQISREKEKQQKLDEKPRLTYEDLSAINKLVNKISYLDHKINKFSINSSQEYYERKFIEPLKQSENFFESMAFSKYVDQLDRLLTAQIVEMLNKERTQSIEELKIKYGVEYTKDIDPLNSPGAGEIVDQSIVTPINLSPSMIPKFTPDLFKQMYTGEFCSTDAVSTKWIENNSDIN